MSKRRREIESWLRRNGLSGAKNAEKAALVTRRGKEPIPRDVLFDHWKEIGRKYGLSWCRFREMVPEPSRYDPQVEAANAIERAIVRLTDHQARFTKTELIRYVAEEAQCRGVGISILLAETENTLATSPDIVQLRGTGNQAIYTTREMLQVEKQLFQTAFRLANSRQHCVGQPQMEKTISKFPTLRSEQVAAIRHLTHGSSVSLVNGVAGSGKTFMLNVAGEIWRRSGFEPIGTCLAVKAAETLEEETGIPSIHIHQLMHQLDTGKRTLDRSSVLVIDEAGMVGTRQLNRLFQLAELSRSKIVLVGDHRQLQAISAGAPFRALADRVGCMEMNQITRQRQPWAREAVHDFRNGHASKALESYWQQGLLSISDDRDEAIEQLVQKWGSQIETRDEILDNQIYAGTNLDVALINDACQSFLLERKHLGNEFVEAGSSKLYQGDRVVITRNLHSLGLRNGSMGTISDVDATAQSIQIRFDDRLQIWIDLNEFADVKLAYAVSTHKGQGQTVENAFVLVGGVMTDRELTYVQSSRARGTTRLYADRLSAGVELDQLVFQMSKSNAKDMAHDFERFVS